MTKSRMKGWIIALAALAVIGTAGTATAGYLTKGFRDWKIQEKQPKADEGKKDEGKASDGGGKEETPILAAPKGASRLRAAAYEWKPPAVQYGFAQSPQAKAVQDRLVGGSKMKFTYLGGIGRGLVSGVPTVTSVSGYNFVAFVATSSSVLAGVTGLDNGYQSDSSGQPASGGDHCSEVISASDFESGKVKPASTDAVIVYGISSNLVSGQTKDIFIDVDRGYSADAIISSVSAVDLFGADVPVTVTDGRDAFDAARIGVYTLKVKATDSFNQTATATLIIHICDYVRPEIRSVRPMTFTADKGQRLTYADIASYVTVTDNGTAHGSSLTVEYSVDGTKIDTSYSHEWTGADVGSHTLTVHAKDGTGNENTVQASITVSDGTAPVLSRRDGLAVSSKITVGVSKTFTMQIADVTQLFKATDNVDGDVSDTLAGNTDADRDFFRNNHNGGEYTLTIRAQDRSGNVVTQAIPVEFVADIPPVFIIADTLVYTDTASPLDIGQLNAIVSNALLAGRKNVSARVVDDGGYLGHENEPGNYNVTYEYTEIGSGAKSAHRAMRADSPTLRTGSFTIVNRRAEKAAEEAENRGRGFFGKVADWFRAVGKWFEKLGNWLRGIFTHFDFGCFIDNEDYAAKYPRKAEAKDSAQPAPAQGE